MSKDVLTPDPVWLPEDVALFKAMIVELRQMLQREQCTSSGLQQRLEQLLKPLYDEMVQEILQSRVLHTADIRPEAGGGCFSWGHLVLHRHSRVIVGSPQGGQTAVILFSVLDSCKRHEVESWAYLKDVLQQLALPATLEELRQLFPHRWKPNPITK